MYMLASVFMRKVLKFPQLCCFLLFTFFSYYKSMEANDPRGVANLDPRGMIGRIYEGYH